MQKKATLEAIWLGSILTRRRGETRPERVRENGGPRGCSAPGRVDSRPLLEERPHGLAPVLAHGARRHDLAGVCVGGLHVEVDSLVEGALAERLGGDAATAP